MNIKKQFFWIAICSRKIVSTFLSPWNLLRGFLSTHILEHTHTRGFPIMLSSYFTFNFPCTNHSAGFVASKQSSHVNDKLNWRFQKTDIDFNHFLFGFETFCRTMLALNQKSKRKNHNNKLNKNSPKKDQPKNGKKDRSNIPREYNCIQALSIVVVCISVYMEIIMLRFTLQIN